MITGIKFNAADWHYMCEGGEHGLFSYLPLKPPSPEEQKLFNGRVLRIKKKEILMLLNRNPRGFTKTTTPTGIVASSSSSVEEDSSLAKHYHMNMVKTVLKDYFDTPQIFELEFDFIKKLYDQTMRSGKVPADRKKDWNRLTSSLLSMRMLMPQFSLSSLASTSQGTSTRLLTDIGSDSRGGGGLSNISSGDISIYKNTVTASLFNNYSRNESNAAILSIEIKPKAGYIASSPIIHPLHRAKYHRPRFQLLQYLHMEGYITKGWKKLKLQTKSRYDPADFYSGERERINTALREVFLTPQNNLKVLYRNHVLYGIKRKELGNFADNEDDICNGECFDDSSHRKALVDFFQIPTGQEEVEPRKKLSAELRAVMGLILEKDEFLTTLGPLQESCDSLDVDGAILVYKRLLDLCDGSHEDAEVLVDSLCPSLESTPSSWSMSSSSPLPDVMESLEEEDLHKKLEEDLKRWNTFLSEHKVKPNDDSDTLDQSYELGTKLVNGLSLITCVYLLQQWLTALTLCDLSFFINLNMVTPAVDNNNTPPASSCESSNIDDDIEWRGVYGWKPNHERKGKKNSAGTIVCKNHGVTFTYDIKIVDCDGKPANKLRKREKKEEVMRLIGMCRGSSIKGWIVE